MFEPPRITLPGFPLKFGEQCQFFVAMLLKRVVFPPGVRHLAGFRRRHAERLPVFEPIGDAVVVNRTVHNGAEFVGG